MTNTSHNKALHASDINTRITLLKFSPKGIAAAFAQSNVLLRPSKIPQLLLTHEPHTTPSSAAAANLSAAKLSQASAYSSMRKYLAALRHPHIASGYTNPLCSSLQLDLLMRGARRVKPAQKDQRLPLTPSRTWL
jgi:hypothetical protein